MTFISKNTLSDQYRKIQENIAGDTVMVHTDIGKIGIIGQLNTNAKMLDDHMEALCGAFSDSVLVFPTFNYDFTKNGLYNVDADPCQVGMLNEHIRQTAAGIRTATPVFNFFVLNDAAFPCAPASNPFDATSAFGEFVSRQAAIVFAGAEFSSNTFVHYVEEMAQVGYRYIKPFTGTLIQGGTAMPVQIEYRVRPLLPGAVVYDWEKLAHDLYRADILKKGPLGKGFIHTFQSGTLLAFWLDKLKKDEHYLLTNSSAHFTQQLYADHGKPLQYERIEGRQM